ncbi:MAG: PqqD family protein [Deltaproteobacteria bacterium]|nr:PqqD family protein [Deltaproteobacteria bacterium]
MKASTTLTQDNVIVHAAGVYSAVLDGTLLIAPHYGGQGHCLDPVGRIIWENIAEPRSISSLCLWLGERYAVDMEICVKDVMDFLSDLLARGMIVIVSRTP